MLQRFATLLDGESEVLAQQMAQEIGKPVTQGRAEVERAVALIQTVVSFVDETLERRCTTDSVARYRALGTVAMITPWNNPLAIPVGKIAPALFYGNAVVWKPSPPASAIASKTIDLLKRAGCPDGLVDVVFGDRSTASILMNDVAIDAVTFTGAIASGYAAQEICARHHIPLQAELGGNNAAIVWHDCDLESAAHKIAEAAFGFAGQRCTANRRVIIEEKCYNAFLQHLEAATRNLNWGDPCDDKTQIGPLISRQSQQQTSTRIERAKEVATRILTPHEDQSNCAELLNNGAYFLATIVCCDDPTAEVVQEESFAPIIVVQHAADWEEAMRLCNGVRQGLAAALFSNSIELRERFLDEAQAGILKINSATADANAQAPFGGWKVSGIGPAEHGMANREFYTRIQAIYGV
jgi:acyl-CoA reductase-like NAD-dependent aldehyde dehydrogenase